MSTGHHRGGNGTAGPPLLALQSAMAPPGAAPGAQAAPAQPGPPSGATPFPTDGPLHGTAGFRMAEITGGRQVVTMGWQPDLPDLRDYDLQHDKVEDALCRQKSLVLSTDPLPAGVDHREFCSPVENQGPLGSCTAQAVVGLMEYMMLRAGGDHIDGSRLFVYKVTRNLLGWSGDRGAYLRTAMQAVSMFGVPPERHLPYDVARFDQEPSAFLYSFADDFRVLNYARLDPRGTAPEKVLEDIKRVLAAGYCLVFGFSVYSSMTQQADVPVPTSLDSLQGGHAVMAVGYDDDHRVANGTMGSLIFRNSWGPGWGEGGYGYLPYEFVLWGIARDFWTSFKWEWVNTGNFS